MHFRLPSRHVASFITDFADQAVLLPVAVVLVAVLFLTGWRRGALVWGLAIVGVLGCMLVLKIVFLSCGQLLVGRELHSPSGHTASAAVIYGGLLAVVARRNSVRARWWWALLPLAVALAVGASRLAVGAHTWLEVITGGAVGVVGAAFAGSIAGQTPRNLRLRPLLAGIGALGLLLHGYHLPAEAAIQNRFSNHFWLLAACER